MNRSQVLPPCDRYIITRAIASGGANQGNHLNIHFKNVGRQSFWKRLYCCSVHVPLK
ncbi:hypothetical protein ACWATR_39210 [Nostoc sp. UIC 10890]